LELPAINLQAQLDALVAENDGYGGGTFLIHKVGDGTWWQGISGDAVADPATPMTPTDTFHVASTSKAFTSALMVRLAEEGLFDLDDPIGSHLDPLVTDGLLVIDSHDYGAELTIRQLLNHTSGLPDYWLDRPWVSPFVNAFLDAYIADNDRMFTPHELLEYARDLDPIGLPGEGYHYGDTGYVICALLAEEVTGATLAELYRDRFFEPLGMDDTYLSWHEDPRWEGTESHRYENTFDMYRLAHDSADWGGGGLVSSAEDLATFMDAMATGELFIEPTTTA